MPEVLIAIYCVLVALASLAGGTLPSLVRLSHTRMQAIMSFVGGLVLGVGLLHLLPHSFAETGSLDQSVWAALLGLLVMFFLIRIFHVHQHGPVDLLEDAPAMAADSDDGHGPDHRHDYLADREQCPTHGHTYSWVGLAAGLTLHTLIDGMALAASVSAEARGAAGGLTLLGIGTFLAVVLHKPLDAMSIATVMAGGGWSARARQTVNFVFAAMCGLGAIAFCVGVQQFSDYEHRIVGWALGFAAGVFLCISLGDILPEVRFHKHDRIKLSAALILGVVLAFGIGFLEPSHQHGQPAVEAQQHHEHR